MQQTIQSGYTAIANLTDTQKCKNFVQNLHFQAKLSTTEVHRYGQTYCDLKEYPNIAQPYLMPMLRTYACIKIGLS